MKGFYAIALLAALVCCHNTFASNPMENEELFEGDIAGIDPYALTDRNAVVDEAEIWPNGTVFYEIGYKLRKVKDIIQEAFEEFENKTCIRFVPKTVSTKDYLKFTISEDAGRPWDARGESRRSRWPKDATTKCRPSTRSDTPSACGTSTAVRTETTTWRSSGATSSLVLSETS
ncbi:metalloendopeptidase [Caerostris extrusa]|uniref:Metalloendopeptidase n=1 Tax=Caerostris extrusa TaxID=172846 RepID=A0AAV4SAU6_CAEEX|nr:metalloendopeptidase [Caerostris extrusa]